MKNHMFVKNRLLTPFLLTPKTHRFVKNRLLTPSLTPSLTGLLTPSLTDPFFLQRNRHSNLTEAVRLRQVAAWALVMIGDARAVESLTAAMNDIEVNVRHQAVEALSKIKR